jgi:nucleotide-binding universal stress UspA family protein
MKPETLCTRVLVGIDRSVESLEAARQAAMLVEPGGSLTLLSAWTLPPPVIGVVSPEFVRHSDERLEIEAATLAVEAAKAGICSRLSPSTKIVRGFARDELIKEIANDGTTLVVVGSHGTARIRGILLGSIATVVVHKAPCAVLIARPAAPEFPSRIAVGIDGSPESAAVEAVAAHLAARFGGRQRMVDARGGDAVSTLVAASAEADLLVVGSCVQHGLSALRSVSERVAHRAQCSTLIVRDQSPA